MEQATKYTYTPQVGLNEYLLVAYPDKRVNEKLAAEMKSLRDQYQPHYPADATPCITIAHFSAMEAMEDTVLRYLQRICSYRHEFEVALNNYSGHPPHTIYLRVQDPAPFRQFVKELKVIDNYVRSCSCPPVHLFTKPYLNIAGRLPEAVYLKAMLHYSQKTFCETFKVPELVLLRKNNEYDAARWLHVFRLQPMLSSSAMALS